MIEDTDSAAKFRLEHGIQFPTVTYRGFSLIRWSMINGVFADITDRRGLKQAFVDNEPSREMVTALLTIIVETSAGDGEGRWLDLAKKFRRVIADHNSMFANELGRIDDDIIEEMLTTWADILRVGSTFQPENLNLAFIYQNQFQDIIDESFDKFEGTPGYDTKTYHWMCVGQQELLKIIQKDYILIPKCDEDKTDITPGLDRISRA